ncbi:thioredoxin reductase 1, cytoplasmic isoform X4 [Dasypus novemcinctus]|uniref:thioredoxin reductase 1, cytoplasmic isoform X4 n=2 Tax=Dasypus novemcinctus TaxID=9361 RepID=UPI00265F7862|nr:thioredoxin reductase 1, cytoplasmic isoform X4 [Dasypus novemcinctus]
MGCAKSKDRVTAAPPERKRRWVRRSSAKDHHPSQTLPENTFTGVRGPLGSTSVANADPVAQLQAYIKSHPVVIFSKSTCQHCPEVKKLFKSMCVPYFVLEFDKAEDRQGLERALWELTSETELPVVFVKQRKIGGHGQILKAYQEGRLEKLLKMNGSEDLPESYDYDLIIIGGGSGGLAAAKEAAKYDKKVMVLDFVTPTPLGTRWGLGGTCVNVGCIPKKLMHQAALLGQALQDSRNYGWKVEETVKHDWEKMTEAVQNYIGSLNWGYRVALREKKVTYENAYGQFVGPHRIKATNNKGKEKIYSAERFLIATGERPRYLGIPGDKEYCISSDDLFSLPYSPGKTLVVGASYVALECAGFLAGIGLDVTVMVRSILLRGFDQDMANKIGEHMEEHGVKFIKQCIPIKVEQIEAGTPGRLRVVARSTNGEETIEGEYNTVLLAIGRDACTRKIGLETVGVKINEKTGKIPVTDEEQTSVPYIYAIGDILEGKLELTPVAIQAGRLLAQRLYAGSTVKCDYENVPTTVFTPLEYGACGLSEEKAVEKFGEENIEVYHSYFWPLEWTIPSRDNNKCYGKIVCNIKDNERVVGFHVLGPNAGEVTQGFAAALKCGMTKKQLDSTIGIHPVCAEVFTTLSVTKRSGGSILQAGC